MSSLAQIMFKRLTTVSPQVISCRGFKWRGDTHYDVLGVSQDASSAQIKSAYLALSKELHPDLNQTKSGSEAEKIHKRFVQVTEAYGVLSNKETRRKYDIEVMMNHSSMKTKSSDDNANIYKNYMPSSFQERARMMGFPEQDPDYYKKHGNYHHKVALFCLLWIAAGVVFQSIAIFGIYSRHTAVLDLKTTQNEETLSMVRNDARKLETHEGQAQAFRSRWAEQSVKYEDV